MSNFKRTRIAPTPSGFLHLGNLYSFVVTAGLARKNNAALLLRIDDLDGNRMRKEYVDDIFDSLHFLGIEWDEGPGNSDDFFKNFSQEHRKPLYESYLLQLKTMKAVFSCSCSRAHQAALQQAHGCPGSCLENDESLDRTDASWRLRTEALTRINMRQFETGIVPLALSQEMNQFVVRKKDGEASYQLASLADDLHFEVDLIVRGVDLLPSTIAQLQLSRLLGTTKFDDISFLHHPLMLSEQGEKLSKSAGATSIQFLRKQGMKKEQVFRLLANLAGLAEPASSLEEWWSQLQYRNLQNLNQKEL